MQSNNRVLRVMGIDPGTATSGYGIVELRGNRLFHICHGVISTPAGMHFGLRLKAIFDEISALLERHRPHSVAIEKLYFSQNVTTGISVAQARGAIAVAVASAGIPLGEFSPLEMKNAVVGYGKATKRQIQEMVKIQLTLDTLPTPDDAADALALAICQVHSAQLERVTAARARI